MTVMPRYLSPGASYTTETVEYNAKKYFYLPLNHTTEENIAIIVNKTGNFGENGDCSVRLKFNPGMGNLELTNWKAPISSSNDGVYTSININ